MGFLDQHAALCRSVEFARNVIAIDAHPLQDLRPLLDFQRHTVRAGDSRRYERDPRLAGLCDD